MPNLDIVIYPDDPLMRPAEPYTKFGAQVRRLAEDMFDAMYRYDGVGLAGPQVGRSKRIFVLDDREGTKMCLVNPEIIEVDGSATSDEGCLSLPELYAPVARATQIFVRAQDENGDPLGFEAHDFLARIIQHETDHLDGVCFVDRLDILTRQHALQEWEEIRSRLKGAPAPTK